MVCTQMDRGGKIMYTEYKDNNKINIVNKYINFQNYILILYLLQHI